MGMVAHQGPGKTGRFGLCENQAQSVYKILIIFCIFKNGFALDAANNHMVQRSRRIYSGLAWHNEMYSSTKTKCQYFTNVPFFLFLHIFLIPV
jgi:hypothetical protein